MPRNMSFALTTEQFKDRTKTVTRRLGWKFLNPGDVVMGCEKCQGIKKGELKRLGLIRVVSVRNEPLRAITFDDVAREGFPGKGPEWFCGMFERHMGIANWDVPVNRIEFEYI